jgi:hypothetical protein
LKDQIKTLKDSLQSKDGEKAALFEQIQTGQ